jgi:hypothetical protein
VQRAGRTVACQYSTARGCGVGVVLHKTGSLKEPPQDKLTGDTAPCQPDCGGHGRSKDVTMPLLQEHHQA